MIASRTTAAIFPDAKELATAWTGVNYILFGNSMLGPLFMALDRILIVALPHSFKKHEKKMRIIKICIAIEQNVQSVSHFAAEIFFFSALAKLLVAFGTFYMVAQFCACIILYGVIVVKIRKARTQIQPATTATPQ